MKTKQKLKKKKEKSYL